MSGTHGKQRGRGGSGTPAEVSSIRTASPNDAHRARPTTNGTPPAICVSPRSDTMSLTSDAARAARSAWNVPLMPRPPSVAAPCSRWGSASGMDGASEPETPPFFEPGAPSVASSALMSATPRTVASSFNGGGADASAELGAVATGTAADASAQSAGVFDGAAQSSSAPLDRGPRSGSAWAKPLQSPRMGAKGSGSTSAAAGSALISAPAVVSDALRGFDPSTETSASQSAEVARIVAPPLLGRGRSGGVERGHKSESSAATQPGRGRGQLGRANSSGGGGSARIAGRMERIDSTDFPALGLAQGGEAAAPAPAAPLTPPVWPAQNLQKHPGSQDVSTESTPPVQASDVKQADKDAGGSFASHVSAPDAENSRSGFAAWGSWSAAVAGAALGAAGFRSLPSRSSSAASPAVADPAPVAAQQPTASALAASSAAPAEGADAPVWRRPTARASDGGSSLGASGGRGAGVASRERQRGGTAAARGRSGGGASQGGRGRPPQDRRR